ncbi:hypothetical protein FACS1894122_06150 [Alphaproteobacteria bacterium]|nr:hypothetical protein FACS1894122_06150 [Alphaproteobacteria bacterium]
MRSERFASCFVLTLMIASGVVFADQRVPDAPGDVYSYSDAGNGSKESAKDDAAPSRASGFYVLLGVCGSFSDNDLNADVKHKSKGLLPGYSYDDFLADYVPAVKERGVATATHNPDDSVSDVVIDGGSSHTGGNKGRFGGTVGVGYLFVCRNGFVVGVETQVDFVKSHEISLKNGGVDFSMKSSGVNPGAYLNLGYRFAALRNSIVYVKVGGVYVSSHVKYSGSDSKIKNSGLVPSAGLGIDVPITGSLSARLEANYRFESKKNSQLALSDTMITDPMNEEGISFSGEGHLQQKSKGYDVRLMVSWYM